MGEGVGTPILAIRILCLLQRRKNMWRIKHLMRMKYFGENETLIGKEIIAENETHG